MMMSGSDSIAFWGPSCPSLASVTTTPSSRETSAYASLVSSELSITSTSGRSLWSEAIDCGYGAPPWMTYRQALELGVHVRTAA